MRDIVMFIGMLIIVPLALQRPFAAFLMWTWTLVMAPNYYLYGFMQPIRYNLVFAAICIFHLFSGRLGKLPFASGKTQLLLWLLLIHASFCAALAYDSNINNIDLYSNFLKMAVFCLLLPYFARTRAHLHSLIIIIVMGIGFHGVVEGLKVLVTAGGHHVDGIGTSMLSDNNHLAVGLVMVLPLLFYLYQYSERKMVRFGFLAALWLTVVSVIGTNSRGGFIGLAIVGFWFVVTSNRKFLSIFISLVVVLTVFFVAPDSWFERINTISEAGDDASFMGRVVAWKISLAIALENPFFGGGFHAVQTPFVWNIFKAANENFTFLNTPPASLIARAAHSIYFEILGDMGFVGLGLFLMVIINSQLQVRNIKIIIKKGGIKKSWAVDMASMLGLSVVAYAVAGAGVSLAYFEVFYMLAIMIDVLNRVAKVEFNSEGNLLESNK